MAVCSTLESFSFLFLDITSNHNSYCSLMHVGMVKRVHLVSGYNNCECRRMANGTANFMYTYI